MFEEVHVPVAICLAFHCLDFVVDAFGFSGGDLVVVPSDNAVPVPLESFCHGCYWFW